jgi:hypothetical protein
MLKVTIRYEGKVLQERCRFYTALTNNDINIVKCTDTKAVIYISDRKTLNELLYNLNCETYYGAYASKIKEFNNKTLIRQRVLFWFLCLFAGIGFGGTIVHVMEAIVKWLA